MNSKITLVGDSNVGKTIFVEKLVTGEISKNNNPTVGAVIKTHIIDNIEYIIWDISGSKSFTSMISLYYNNSDCVLMFYDMTLEEKYSTLIKWINTILKSNNKNIPVVLVGVNSNNTNATEINYNDSRIKTLLNNINLISTITMDILEDTHKELLEKFNLTMSHVDVTDKMKIELHQSEEVQCCTIV